GHGQEKRSAKHESSFHEGFGVSAGGRSSDSGLPSAPPSQPKPVALRGAGASPLTAAGPSRTRTGFPRRSPFLSRPSLSSARAGGARARSRRRPRRHARAL